MKFLYELRYSESTKGLNNSKIGAVHYTAPDGNVYLLSELKTHSVKNLTKLKNRLEPKGAIFSYVNQQGKNPYYTFAVFSDKNKNPKYVLVYFKRTAKNFIPQNVAKKAGFTVVVEKGASEALGIQSSRMLVGAPRKTIHWMGQSVQVFEFDNSDKLKQVLTKNIKNHKNINKYNGLSDALIDFIHGGAVKISWPEGIPDTVKNEVAKYLSEIFVGIGFMDKTITNAPFTNEVVGFAVPVDSRFSGIDSFIITRKGLLVPLSSKSGAGAKASLFTNILNVALEDGYMFEDKTLNGLQQTTLIGGDGIRNAKDSKMILYSYMLRKVLRFSDQDIPDSKQFYKDLFRGYEYVKKKYPVVIERLQKFKWSDASIKKLMARFPASFTAMLTREVAYRLNKSAKAKSEMLDVLGIKRFFQASLNKQKFINTGETQYKFVASDKNDIFVVGNKSPINDLQARQGLLNYQIR